MATPWSDCASVLLTGKRASEPVVQQHSHAGQRQQEELELAGDLHLALSSFSWNLRAVAFTALYAASMIGALWLLVWSNSAPLRLLACWVLVELCWANFMTYRYGAKLQVATQRLCTVVRWPQYLTVCHSPNFPFTCVFVSRVWKNQHTKAKAAFITSTPDYQPRLLWVPGTMS